MSKCHTARDGAATSPDVLVIGAGSAGFSAAITAADAGARVVIAGMGTIGGTCVNTGCIPSKTLIRAMGALHDANAVGRFNGITAAAGVSSWQAMVAQKRALVERLRVAKYEEVLAEYPGISYVPGRARFVNPDNEIEVDGTLYRPCKIVVATGASPRLPSIDGIHDVPVLDSADALELEELPASLLVIGGGIIGCELSQMFRRAGVRVTICCRSRLLPDAEPEASDALAALFRAEDIEVCQGVRYREFRQESTVVELTYHSDTGERTVEAERALVATGRRPNIHTLHLENAGIETNAKGGIRVDEFMQTTHPHVYAAGDVTAEDMYVYMAAYGGKIAAKNALLGNDARYSNAAMPAVVFTDPQLATVGLTEAAARAIGFDVKTSVVSLDDVPRFIVSHDSRGLIKLVADNATDRLLGSTILAPEAGDSIQTVVMALKAGATTEELGDTVFPYLTAVEGVKLAAQGFKKDIKKLSCCAG